MTAGKPIEIICSSCGKDSLIRREPCYKGFKKVGERLFCAACGYEYPDENSVPYRGRKKVTVFSDEDKSRTVDVFAEDEKGRNCRYCRHYVVNPFIQRCGLHHKEVQATDICDDFSRKPAPPPEKKTEETE